MKLDFYFMHLKKKVYSLLLFCEAMSRLNSMFLIGLVL